MMRTVVVVGTLLLGVGAVMAQQEIAVQQDNFMRGQAKSLYTVMLKMVKGEIPYNQAAVDAAIRDLEESVPKIPTVFATNPKQDVVAESLAEQGRFRLEGASRRQGACRRQRQDQGCRQPEGRLRLDQRPVQRLPRDLPRQAQVTIRSLFRQFLQQI